MRLVIDTNLWISFIISKKLSTIENLLTNNDFVIIFSYELLVEIETILHKPKLSKFIKNFSLSEMLIAFDPFTEIVQTTSNIQLCRDKNDNFLLNLSVDGNADFLITGDKDLLVLKQIEKTKIVSYTDFLTL